MDPNYAQRILTKNVFDYNHIADHFSNTRYQNWHEIIDSISQYVHEKDQILDIGCGNGRLINSLPTNINYTGIDTSPDLINKAISTHKSTEHGYIQFFTGSILEIMADTNHFDVIFAIAILHHIPSEILRTQACQELYRVLKPNGYLIMTNWNLFQEKYLPYHNTNLQIDKNLDPNDTLIPWKNPNGNTLVNRYYHAFKSSEIKELLIKQNFIMLKNTLKKHNIVTICQK